MVSGLDNTIAMNEIKSLRALGEKVDSIEKLIVASLVILLSSVGVIWAENSEIKTAAQESAFNGGLDIQGLPMSIDPKTGSPVFTRQWENNPDIPGETGGRHIENRRWRQIPGLYREFEVKCAEPKPFLFSQINKDNLDDIYWHDGFYGQGLSGDIYAVAFYKGKIIVGGNFKYAAQNEINYLAAWDGSDWSSLGFGLSGPVYSMLVFRDTLFVGGDFGLSGDGMISLPSIAAWDGAQWSPLGAGLSSRVYALTVYNDKLIAAGSFRYDGSYSAELRYIAAWDGAQWASLGPGLNASVFSLAVYNNNLIAGGYFTNAGDFSTEMNCVGTWNGSKWSPLGSGFNSTVNALAVYKDTLIAGGSFWYDGQFMNEFHCIAAWGGSQWRPLGTGLSSDVCALSAHDDRLIAGGRFTQDGDYETFLFHIAAWENNGWEPIGLGTNGDVMAMASSADSLIAAGGFYAVDDTIDANKSALWDGHNWKALGNVANAGNGLNNSLRAMAIYDNKLVAAGAFTKAGALKVNHIAAWDGSHWSSLGPGLGGEVSALAIYDGLLIAGGNFVGDGLNSVELHCIAAWDGLQWLPLGVGLNSSVRALAVYDNILIAGGNFSATADHATSMANIAAWDGFHWFPLGSGLNSAVYALTVHNNVIFAGGEFQRTNDYSAELRYVGVWDGVQWSPLGSGFDSPVYALLFLGDALIAGGYFINDGSNSAPLHHIALWNGTQWLPLEDGLNSTVYALAAYKNILIAGGYFSATADYDSPLAGIAAWDGAQWRSLGAGTDKSIWRFEVYNDALIVGGDFNAAGNKPSAYIAAFNPNIDEPPPPPESLSIPARCEYISLAWKVVEEASAYCIYKDGRFLIAQTDTVWHDYDPGTSEHCYSVSAKKGLWNESQPSGAVCASAVSTEMPKPLRPAASSDCQYIYLVWNAVEEASHYYIIRDGESKFCCDDTSWIDYNSDTTKHYYQVIAGNDCAFSDPSDSVLAAVIRAPERPSRLIAKVACGAVDIAWSFVQEADFYQLYRDGAFLANVAETTYQDDNPGNSLRRYKIRSINGCDSSAFSDSAEIATFSSAPGSPGYVKPDNNSIHKMGAPLILDWEDVPNQTSYELEISRTMDFGFILLSKRTPYSQYTFLNLDTGTYYWRAKAYNECGWSGAPSEAWSFRVETSSDFPEPNPRSLPTSFSLGRNYPNPFNPTTRFDFALPRACEVEIKVYDVMGREIAVLARGYYPAGYHKIIWNGENSRGEPAASGIYIYRMAAGDFIENRKMILLK
jgi:hypothetical protein